MADKRAVGTGAADVDLDGDLSLPAEPRDDKSGLSEATEVLNKRDERDIKKLQREETREETVQVERVVRADGDEKGHN